WGYMVAHGATTIWEHWDGDTQDPTMNSEALLLLAGNLEAWFYQTLAGIQYDVNLPGFKHVIIRPEPVGDLRFVDATFRSGYGTISSRWSKEDDVFRLEVVIPPN